jgi:hypothetical protein
MQDTLTRWRSEKTAAYLSAAVAAAERDTTRAKLFRDMAASAEKLRWYFRTLQDQSIRPVADVCTEGQSMKQAAN